MTVHEVARQGFGSEAAVYERSRPSYPPEAVAWLVDALAVAPGRRVVDLAAGTGKLTRLLVPTGADVTAVEPVEGMRRVLATVVPGVPIAAGTAEALPFAAGALDAVTIAQALHWFDTEAAFAELARVLRPGGRVGVIWNARDRSVDWVDQAWAIMDRVEKRAPWRDHENWNESALGDRPGFGPMHEATFRHEQAFTPEGVVERFRGVSHVAALPPPDRGAVLDEVRRLLATHPETQGRDELFVPYRVDAYWCERT
ncbi:MAG TPA: class I SAM-dependent methyltransferase [Acidimicrobiia bacterium]